MSMLFQQFVTGSAEESNRAYGIYFSEYHQAVLASLKNLCDDDQTAQDLAQDVFNNCWDRRHSFRDENHLVNSFFFMAKKYYLQHLYKNKLFRQVSEQLQYIADASEDSADVAVTQEAVFAAIEKAEGRLPNQQKAVTELHIRQDLPIPAVAQRLQLAEQTVRNHKTAALGFLRKELYGLDFSFLVLLLLLNLCLRHW